MNIQSINENPYPNIGFKKLIVKEGSFRELRKSKYFPEESYPNYSENLKIFYKKLMVLKKRCDENQIYNVVIKPGANSLQSSGKIVIEDAASKREQAGFKRTFEDLLRIETMEPQSQLSKTREPNIFKRAIKNWEIKQRNKKLEHKQMDMKEFLNIVYKRIEDIVQNAEYLTELHNLKKLNTK